MIILSKNVWSISYTKAKNQGQYGFHLYCPYFYAVFEHFCERSTEKKSHKIPILNYLRLDTLINFKIIFSLQLGFSGNLIAGSAMYKYFKNMICVKNREAQTFISIDT